MTAGSFVAWVGASGAGKSTWLKTVNRLVEPSAGRVLIDGAPVDAIEPHRLRRRIGYIFQNIGLFPHMTVAENIAIVLRLAGVRRNHPRLAELLSLVALPGIVAAPIPALLSGCRRHRVGFARPLSPAPCFILILAPVRRRFPVPRI